MEDLDIVTMAQKYDRAIVRIASVDIVRGRSGWTSPDKEIRVYFLPTGISEDFTNNRRQVERVGGAVYVVGRGYSKNRGPRSMYGRALARATDIVAQFCRARTPSA